jgi:hypothetical protein
MARSLERLIELSAERQPLFKGAVIQPCTEQVHEALPQILGLASRLRAPEPVAARGVASLQSLLCDGAGPCYLPTHPDALAIALQAIADMLDATV